MDAITGTVCRKCEKMIWNKDVSFEGFNRKIEEWFNGKNELCDHLLGKDWYVVDPLPNCQVNPIIVEEIEQKYRNKVKIKLKFVIDK